MIKRITSSLAFRLPILYRHLLKYKQLRTIDKPGSDLHVLMMTGKAHLPLLRMAVYAIAKNWDELPNLTVINDGSVTDGQLKNTLKFWRGRLTLQSWQECSAWHRERGRHHLVTYADYNPFGKKMSVILCYAEAGPVLWVDSDILFYQDPKPFLPPVTDLMCGGAEDWFRAYDDQVLHLLPPNDLAEHPGMNAGILYINGKHIYEQFGIDRLLAQVHPNYTFFTEQTIFAYIASKSYRILWHQNVIKNTQEDNQQMKVKPPAGMMARHYTSNMRLLFWRDAMLNL